MAETLSLMEFLQALLTDAELHASFGHDPQGTLAGHGLADLSPADVHDALVLVQDNETVDFTLDLAGTPAPPPPPPTGESHEAAVEYLARFLDGPQHDGPQHDGPQHDDPQHDDTAPDDAVWAGVDPDAGVATAPHDDGPPGAFGTSDGDQWYGAGAPAPSADHSHRDETSDHVGAGDDVPGGYDVHDLGGYGDPGSDLGGHDLGDDLGDGFDDDFDDDLPIRGPHDDQAADVPDGL
jgi:hypothetical protein